MKMKPVALALLVGATLCASPVWADRGGGRGYGHRQAYPSYGYNYARGGHNFWGPLGVIVGATLLYSALQPRTVYYEPQVVYAPPVPPVPVYYVPQAPVVQSYALPSVQQIEAPVYVMPQTTLPPPPLAVSGSNVQYGPGASGAQWWYVCRKPAGYYPYIKECPSGWDKVAPTPPDFPNH